MYQPLPTIAEDLDFLQTRLRSERDTQLRPRLHLLVLLKSGQVTSRRQAAAHLAVHRNTITGWLRRYQHGGLEALLTYKEPGAPAGQKTLPPAVFAQLQARLASATGFASYVEIQHWLRKEFALEVPYQTLHGIVHYQLKAKLKRPRPRHGKKHCGGGRLCEAMPAPSWDNSDFRAADAPTACAGFLPRRKPSGPPVAHPSPPHGLRGDARGHTPVAQFIAVCSSPKTQSSAEKLQSSS
jgi:transposase